MTWQARAGINWPDGKGERRAEPGDVVPDAVVRDNPWLLEQGAVEATSGVAPVVAPEPEPEEPTDG